MLRANFCLTQLSIQQLEITSAWRRVKLLKRWSNDSNQRPLRSGMEPRAGKPEAFVKALNLPKEILVIMVNESGASIYSASEVARDEFPDKDVTVRGAVSIGRRLMDPLAELVKLDPKSIGVGQYQHDVDQKFLKESLRRCGSELCE